jgi:phosphomannomutase/phosphoglucomutase
VKSNIFREYDIRGLVGSEISDPDVVTLGRAMGTYMEARGIKRMSLGRDCRLSSDRFRDLLLEGLLASGRQVVDVGVCPTPLLYYSVWHHQAQGGVMITASHNPPQYNGFKVLAGKSTIHGQEIQNLRRIVEEGRFSQGRGQLINEEIIGPYMDYVAANIHLQGRLRLAVDAGNGTAGPVAVPLMRRLGIEVTPLFCEMDGRFPNHEPDPTIPENLRDLCRVVLEKGLPAGVAYDGDSDRVGVVDEKGQPLWGDMLLAIFARSILKEEPGATLIGEVKCSQNLYDDIARQGGVPIMWKAGHSLIKQKMAETGAVLAGEMSGHMFFKHRWFGFDDAIYASLRLAELLSARPEPLSTWLADLPPVVSTPEIRVDCPDEIKFRVVQEVTASLRKDHRVVDVDGVRVITPEGWGLVRASNTQPALVLRFEARDQAKLEALRRLVEGAVKTARDRG